MSSHYFPKMPGNPGFFIVFESEGPESWLIIKSLCMWWKLILRFTMQLLDQAICWGSLNVSPFRPHLLRWPDFPLTNSLNLCPESKSCMEYSGKMRVDLRRKFHHAVCRCSVISLGSCCCYSAPAFNFSLCPPVQRSSLSSSQQGEGEAVTQGKEWERRS